MKKITIAILLTIFLTGCTSNTKNTNFLSEKEKCFNYKEKLEKENNYNNVSEGFSVRSNVSKIFYSPKQNSCLYVIELSSSTKNNSGSNGAILEYKLVDLFNGKQLLYEEGCDGELHCGYSTIEAKEAFESKIKPYE